MAKTKKSRETVSVRIARELRNELKKLSVLNETTIGKIIEQKFGYKYNQRLPIIKF